MRIALGFASLCAFAPLVALALFLGCGPSSDDGAVHSELAEVVAPCRTDSALERPVANTYDDRGRCGVSLRGLKDNTPHWHPIKSEPEECPFACGRVGTFWWIHHDGAPDETLGVLWEGQVP